MENKNIDKNFLIDKDEREIYLFSSITTDKIIKMTNFINRLNNESTNLSDEIKIYIDSGGGIATSILGLCETIINSDIPVHTICMGRAYSAAFMIFISGHRRIVTTSSVLMHHLTMLVQAEPENIYQAKKRIEGLEKIQDRIDQFITRYTKIPLDDLLKLRETGGEIKISDTEAIEKGCADDTFINYVV